MASNEELVCCGEPMRLVAESPLGVRTASHRGPSVGRGIPVRIWLCQRCLRDKHEGWCPPCWISAVAQRDREIKAELEADLERRGEAHRWNVWTGQPLITVLQT